VLRVLCGLRALRGQSGPLVLPATGSAVGFARILKPSVVRICFRRQWNPLRGPSTRLLGSTGG